MSLFEKQQKLKDLIFFLKSHSLTLAKPHKRVTDDKFQSFPRQTDSEMVAVWFPLETLGEVNYFRLMEKMCVTNIKFSKFGKLI